ncbi:glycosyltransferase family 2 protein [Sphingobacterium rhinopitheci]|uniref:glycosyltransferase family 2 protein n=1 Tax=Sphingobacterium rhinopitheci TaxID=2781960 RepID=UPI001F52A1CC|nr:glycosyltransferase family 2 protein [Sphingobacterium rhinopitheci]MCI0920531.1 glycosyltransferase family 2 protein [Sphingobacterium rhinopitheci]
MNYFAFWACFLLVFYTYVGYALVIYILSKYWPYKNQLINSSSGNLPVLTLCIAAYNEEDIIPIKMDNCLSLNYPSDKLRILWVIDGSNDNSHTILKEYSNIDILFKPERLGKTAALNRAMVHIDTEYVVFTDANCLLSQDALLLIANQFEAKSVGCVSGEKRVAFYDEDTTSSKGEGFYWKYESYLKKLDNQYYTTVGAAGELFAIRTALFEPVEENILLDDFVISMRIARSGYRIAYTPEAYAVERGSLNIEEEKKRKVRIAAGGWQSVILFSNLLNIFKFGKLSFQYISHRVLRWTITPFALFLLLPINIVLVVENHDVSIFYIFTLIAQILFYLLAFIGYLKRDEENIKKVFFIPFYFMFMNVNVIEGLIYLKNKSTSAVWEKSKRKF